MRFGAVCLVAAVACSHAAPSSQEPAAATQQAAGTSPSQQSAAEAPAPAQPSAAPQGSAQQPGVAPQAGAAQPGAAGPQAGAPQQGRRKFDLASAITAAGREDPKGLDWGDKGQQPASTLFKNVKVLGGVSGDRFMAAMQSMQANLGQKCALCHAVEKKDFASDEKDEKQRARVMMELTQKINDTTFRGRPRTSCWMCHRGEQEPAKSPASPEVAPFFPKLSEADAKRPAGEVFKSIKSLKDLPAGQLGVVMSAFNQALGVKCTFCHVEKDWAAEDKKEKQAARAMLAMTHMVAETYYAGKSPAPVTCWTCHRGAEEPPRKPRVVEEEHEHQHGAPQQGATAPKGG